MLTRPALKARLRRDGLRLRKRLGQHFLVSERVRDRLVEAIDLRPSDVVVEIGAGTGALTERLVEAAGRVIAFEVDGGLAAVLGEQLAGAPGLEIRCEDVLKTNFGELAAEAGNQDIVLVGNLPYSITTPIITRVLESGLRFRAAYFTMQREVAQRLLAAPGSRDRGAITYLVEYHVEARRVLVVPRTAFEPVPAVKSVLIELIRRTAPAVSPQNPELMFALIRAAFGARRKMLKNALRRLKWVALPDDKLAAAARLEGAVRDCGLDPRSRAEQLTLQQFADLGDALVRAQAAD